MKLIPNQKEEVFLQWGELLLPGEQILAAQYCRTSGKMIRGTLWGTAEGLVGLAGTLATLAAGLTRGIGEHLTEEGVRKLREEDKGEADRFPAHDIVLAITDRRYLLFLFEPRFKTIKLHFLRDYAADWLTNIIVKLGIVSNKFILVFYDGSAVALEATKGSGKPHELLRAFQALRATT